MRIAIVTGGALHDLAWLKEALAAYEVTIAVDRGLEAFDTLGLRPDIILGDFDSYRGDAHPKQKFPDAQIEIYPDEKDWTDTELALQRALKLMAESETAQAQGPFQVPVTISPRAARPSAIDIYGGFGNRIDHLYANLMLLGGLNEKSPKVRALDPDNRIELLHPGSYVIERERGYHVSFLPLDEAAVLTLKGFKYSGTRLNMGRHQTLGVSNELLVEAGTVELHEGRVFLMQCRDAAD
jgi:thiamine pyrophosphokinase